MAVALRQHGHEAIAIGRFTSSEETIDTLCAWADRIVVMEPHMRESIPGECLMDTWCVDVGPDRWGSRIDPELKGLVEEGLPFITSP